MSRTRPGRADLVQLHQFLGRVIGFLALLAVVFLVDVAPDHLVLDLLNRLLAPLHHVDNRPVLHHIDAVGQLHHLVHPCETKMNDGA